MVNPKTRSVANSGPLLETSAAYGKRRSKVFAWAFLVVITGCAARPLAHKNPTPVAEQASARKTVQPKPPVLANVPDDRNPCDQAEQLRAQLPRLLGEGKLHRSLEVIRHANQLCPSGAEKTQLAELEITAELGRYQETKQLASKILAQSLPKEAEHAVKQALALAEFAEGMRAPQGPPTEDPLERAQSLSQAAEALATRGRYAEASQHLLEAFPVLRRYAGRALARAGHFAMMAGDAPGAQRLFDRAIDALERQYEARAVIEPVSNTSRLEAMVWSPTEPLVALAEGRDVVLLATPEFREVLRLRGHRSDVAALAFSPDARLIASGGEDGTVRIWNVFDGTLAESFEGTRGAVTSLAFSRDGDAIAVVAAGKTIRLNQTSDSQLLRVLRGHTENVSSVAFSPDNKLIASGSWDKTVRLWRRSDGQLLSSLLGHSEGVSSVAFSADGKLLGSASNDGTIRLWRIPEGSPVRTLVPQRWPLSEVAFAPGGRHVAAVVGRLAVGLWPVPKLDSVESWGGQPGDPHFFSLAFRPGEESPYLLASDKIFHAAPGLHAVFQKRDDGEAMVTVAPNGKLFASASTDSRIHFWRLLDGKLLGSLDALGKRVVAFAFTPDAKTLVSSCGDQKIRLWRVDDRSLLDSIDSKEGRVTSLALTPDGSLIASGSDDGTLRIWRLSDRRLIREIPSIDPRRGISSLAFAPDGKLLASADTGGSFQLLRLANDSIICAPENNSRVTAIAFAPDGKALAVRRLTGDVELLRSSDCTPFRHLGLSSNHFGDSEPLVFSPDHQTLTAIYDDGILTHQVADGEKVRGFGQPGRTPRSFGMTPQNDFLISASVTGLGVWRVDDQELVMSLVVPKDHDVAITLSGSGEYFDLAGRDQAWALKNALVCRIGPATLPAEVCAERAWVPGLGKRLMTLRKPGAS